MTIECFEIKEGRTGKGDYKQGRSYTRAFQVVSDADIIGPIQATAAVAAQYGVVFGAFYRDSFSTEYDFGALCTVITANQGGTDRQFIVTAEYTARLHMPEAHKWNPETGKHEPSGTNPSNQPQDPTKRLPVWSFDERRENVAVFKDMAGVVLTNSHHDPFYPAIEAEVIIPVYNVSFYRVTYDLTYVATYNNMVNSQAFFGFGPRRLRCVKASAKEVFENNLALFQYEISMEEAPQCEPYLGFWNPGYILDQGFQYYKGVSPKRTYRATDDKGVPSGQPVLLDGFGYKLSDGGSPSYIPFQKYGEVDFIGLIPII